MKKSQQSAKKKANGSPEVLIFFAMVLTPSIIIGQLLGAGVAAIMGGFITMFTYISCTGGSLRANLIRFASLGPLVAIGSITPRFLAEVTVVGGMALAIGFVFLASILPLRGRRYAATSLGMGMGVLLGYALPLGNLNIYQLFMAAVAGLAGTLLLLVVLALKDPTGPTRNAVAGLLESTERGFATAFDSWTADGAPRWLASVMVAAGRYHLARNVLELAPELSADVTATLKWAETTAQKIAAHVRLKDPAAALEIGDPPEVPENVGDQSEPLRQSIITALSNATQASTERNTSGTPVPREIRAKINTAVVRAAVGQGAIQLRHAIRSTLAVTLAFGVLLIMEPTTALVPTLLMTTFALVQASWNATMSRARDRFVGIMMGGVIVVLALLVVPEALMFALAITGLVVGMWFITDRPAIGAAGMIVMSVGINTEIRDLDPGAVMVEYIMLATCAILIATVIGFAVVPAWRPPELSVRIATARSKTVDALQTLASLPGSEFTAWGQQVVGARAAIDQLVADHDKLDDLQRDELDQTRTDLRNTMLAAIFYTLYAPNDSAKELTLMADRIAQGHHGLQS